MQDFTETCIYVTDVQQYNIISQLVFIGISSDNDVWSMLTDLIVLEHL